MKRICLTNLPSYPLTYLSYLLVYLPTHPLTYLNQPINLLIYLNQPTNLPTYVPTYLPLGSNHQSIKVAYPYK